jgi:hypothetical protein
VVMRLELFFLIHPL